MGLPGKRRADEEQLASDLLDALAQRTLAGDAGARRNLVKLLLPLVHRCVTVTLKACVTGGLRACSPEEIEDLAQDAFLKLLDEDHVVLRTWAGRPRPLIPYVWQVTRRVVIDHLRTKSTNPRSNVPLPADPRSYEEWEDPEARLEAADFERAVLVVLKDRLGERGLTVLELSRKGLTTEQIAEEAGMSHTAVLNHRSRIAAAVRRILDRMPGLGASERQG